MEGSLGKEDSNSAKDLQEKNGSGHKRQGSVQPSSPRAGKKPKRDIDRDHREKKKGEMNELKKENGILQESYWRFLGQIDQINMELRERGEEIISLRIKQDRHDNSLRELEELTASGEEKMSALKEEHAQEIHALKAKHAQELLERDRKFNALKAKHAQELLERDRKFNALKEEHELHMRVCTSWDIDLGNWLENAGEMNNPMETPATAQATTNCFNSDHFASQMA